jgi:hypothetical protein
MSGLSKDEVFKSNVDFLTEVVRRFSEAVLASRPFSTVSMKSPFRLEKVRSFVFSLHAHVLIER